MDEYTVRAISGLRAPGGVPRVLGRLFRQPAFRAEGRIACDRARTHPANVPQLVPAPIPVRLRDVPLREGPRRMRTGDATSTAGVEQFAADAREYLRRRPR